MYLLIDKNSSVVVLFKEEREVQKYINDLKLEKNITSPRDFNPICELFNCFNYEDWKVETRELFDIKVKEVNFGKEVYF